MREDWTSPHGMDVNMKSYTCNAVSPETGMRFWGRLGEDLQDVSDAASTRASSGWVSSGPVLGMQGGGQH